jgi:hypothetical protein
MTSSVIQVLSQSPRCAISTTWKMMMCCPNAACVTHVVEAMMIMKDEP